MKNKFKYFGSNSLSITAKICLAGMFTALVMVFQKLLAINYIPVIPFLRISFGAVALIVFSSIILGPIFGFIIGAGSDILGYFIFDIKTFPFFPQVTLIYGVLGLVACFVFWFVKKIKNRKLLFSIEIGSMGILCTLVNAYIWTRGEEITLYSTTYPFSVTAKIIISISIFVLLASLIVFMHFHDKKSLQKTGISSFHVSFTLFILEVFVLIIFGSIMKGWAFGFATYPVILLSQIIVGFINIMLNTILLSLFFKVTQKFKFYD